MVSKAVQDGHLWVSDRYIPPRGGKRLGDWAGRVEQVVPHGEFERHLAAACKRLGGMQ